MGLGCLADLEEIVATSDRLQSVALFEKAIGSARRYYSNMHVYPYTYLGGFYYRKGCFKQALWNWAQAAEVISKYV